MIFNLKNTKIFSTGILIGLACFIHSCGSDINLLGDLGNIGDQKDPKIDIAGIPSSDSSPQGASAPPAPITLELISGAYEYSDGTHAKSCIGYRNSPVYASEGDAVYRVYSDEAGSNSAFPVYCDMTTQGGGWTLIGRGREAWAWDDAGKNPNDVTTNLMSPAGFVPAYYAESTVDLIANKGIKDLTDGLRIKRVGPTATDGSTFQELRWFYASQTNWSWLLDNTFPLSNITIDGATHPGTFNTRDTVTSSTNNQFRVFTWAWVSHANKRCFSYGSSVTAGTNSPTNFLWENSTERHPCPYTEVYIRG